MSRSCAGDCPRARLSRRTFIALGATAVGALAAPGQAVAVVLNPPAVDTATLVGRGRPTEYTGAALPKIGMPVGGGTTGQEYQFAAHLFAEGMRIHPEDFRCAFTAAEGWGSYRQRRSRKTLSATVDVRYGRVRLTTVSFETAGPARQVEVRQGHSHVPATVVATGNRAVVTLTRPATVSPDRPLEIDLRG